MSINTQNQFEQQDSNSAKPGASPPFAAPQNPMTASQAALVRAQAARASHPISPQTVPEDAGSVMDDVCNDLHGQKGLTYVLIAEEPTSCAVVSDLTPGPEIAALLAYHLKFGRDVGGGRLDWSDPERPFPDDGEREETLERLRSGIARLRSRYDIRFVLAWHLEPDELPHMDATNYFPEEAFSGIAELLAAEIQMALCI